MMERKMLKVVLVVVMAMSVASYAGTVAYWDFEDGAAGQSFTPAGDDNGSGGSVDTVGGVLMRGWNEQYGPSFSAYTPNSSNLSSRNNSQDGYTTDGTLNAWSPSVWTIETSVFMYSVGGWKTIIGRDGSSQAEAESDFYLANNGIDDRFRINIDTVGGERWILDSDFIASANRWYGLAVTSDGQTLTMYIDMGDGNGYSSVGSLDMSAQSVADNALGQDGSNWTFGRGWYDGSHVDHMDGHLDDVRFSDEVVAVESLIGIEVPEPATMVLLGFGALAMLRKRK